MLIHHLYHIIFQYPLTKMKKLKSVCFSHHLPWIQKLVIYQFSSGKTILWIFRQTPQNEVLYLRRCRFAPGKVDLLLNHFYYIIF